MRRIAALIPIICMLVFFCSASHAQTPAGDKDVLAIRQLMDRQATDWNRGDLESFASGYKDSPNILFVGQTISRGYDEMLARYRKAYPTRDAMGKLVFTNLEVVPLDARFATATGNFHLERTSAGGGNANGIFSLVFEKTPGGWKIIRDHTTAFTSSKR